MKKIVIALCLSAASTYTMAAGGTWSASGTAAEVCALGTGYEVTAVASTFVATAFTPKCSANTNVQFDATASAAAVGAVSTKGSQAFKGNTNGGAVVVDTTVTCPTTGCTSTESGGALTTALGEASS